ncbi:MAG: cytochrome c oxidase subunit II [Planctomycetes bacterium]|nr:cytochrome c oxidase subunit II [Planctomycetota bacterium]
MFAHLIQDPPAQHVENPAPPIVPDAWGQMPKLASTFDHVDGLFYFTYAVCIFFFVLITGVLAYSVVAYRRKTFDQPAVANTTHNTPLEVVWTVIPLIIVMVMFAWGYYGARDMTNIPADARMYRATAKQWNWTFKHPGSQDDSYGEVWMEVGKNAAFVLDSTDVLHAFYLPSMRVKRDVIPGRNQTVWFQPTEVGDYHLFCAEYCGDHHSKMYAQVHVVTAAEFAKKPWAKWEDSTPALAAVSAEKQIYKTLCASCHTTNGTKLVGPSWQGLFVKRPDGSIVGAQREVIEGGQRKTITVDEAYIAESIRKPDQKKVVGYEAANMTAYELEDRKIKAVVEYMKTLAVEGK